MLQLLVNASITGILLALISWSFGIIFTTTKVFHFAHAAVYVTSVYIYIAVNNLLTNVLLSVIISLAGTFLIIFLIELIVYRPLSEKKVNQNITLISSLGLNILLVNIISIIFGNQVQIIKLLDLKIYSLQNIAITNIQLLQFICGVSLMFFIYIAFKYSRSGLEVKAVAEDSIKASVLGVNVRKIRILVFGIGSAIAGSVALLNAIETGISPNPVFQTLTHPGRRRLPVHCPGLL